MAVHKFYFAQVPLASLKKRLLKNATSARKPDSALSERKPAHPAPTSTRSRSKA